MSVAGEIDFDSDGLAVVGEKSEKIGSDLQLQMDHGVAAGFLNRRRQFRLSVLTGSPARDEAPGKPEDRTRTAEIKSVLHNMGAFSSNVS